MKDHIPTLAIVSVVFMILAAIVLLWFHGAKTDGPVLLGLVGSVGTAVGILGGFSQNKNTPAPPPGTTMIASSEPNPKSPNESLAGTPPQGQTK